MLKNPKRKNHIAGLPDWEVAGMDKFDRFNARCKAEGRTCELVRSGLLGYNKKRYEPDGLIYVGRKKTPIGRYLRIERCGGVEFVIRPGRIVDVHAIEKKRWDTLIRISDVLSPKLTERSDLVRAYAKSIGKESFSAHVDGELKLIEIQDKPYGISISNAELDKSSELDVLDTLGHNWSAPEADKLASALDSVQHRLNRAWLLVGRLTGMLVRAIDLKINPNESRPVYNFGDIYHVKINGRIYPTWIGRGGVLKTEEFTNLWPCPTNKTVDLDTPC